ncbi:NADP-dependent oxidoreductase domain-containing protein [Coemansia spiralis]|nr:NADP-dependent oxidoreductase domain-containing protein [Coemansia spiralis]
MHPIKNKRELPPLALGCGAFSGAYGPVSQEEVVKSVRTALSNGVTLLDTSPYYNDSEIKLGKALNELKQEFPRSSYSICTKLGRYGYQKTSFNYSVDRVASSINESMRRLHTDYLDIVLCHDVEFVDVSQIVDEALPKLFELKRQGVVHRVGISGYPLNVLLKLAQVQQERKFPLDVCLSYCNFNLHCQLLAEYEPKLRAAGVDLIIAASPLSMGLLREDTTHEWHPGSHELKNAVEQCITLIHAHNSLCHSESKITLAKMAENYAFSYDKADIHLVGATTASEVEHALNAYKEARALKLYPDGKYANTSINHVYRQIMEMLSPFSRYTWPSPPEDA